MNPVWTSCCSLSCYLELSHTLQAESSLAPWNDKFLRNTRFWGTLYPEAMIIINDKHIHTHIHMCAHTNAHTHTHIYVCIYIYIYINIYIIFNPLIKQESWLMWKKLWLHCFLILKWHKSYLSITVQYKFFFYVRMKAKIKCAGMWVPVFCTCIHELIYFWGIYNTGTELTVLLQSNIHCYLVPLISCQNPDVIFNIRGWVNNYPHCMFHI